MKCVSKISCYDSEGKLYSIHNCGYLLDKIIRNYQIFSKNYHVYEETVNLLESLTLTKIKDYLYEQTIDCDKAYVVHVNKYKGNYRLVTETIVRKRDKLRFNDFFHAEHMVTIKTITTKLL